MQVGVCTISEKHRRIEDVIEIIAGLDVDGIEVWGHDHIRPGDRERCQHIARAAREHGLDIPVYGSYLTAGTEEFQDDVHTELQIADRLDAELIRIWAGNQEYDDVSDDHWTAVLEDVRELAATAADRDIEITVERHAGTVTNTTDGATALIEATPATVGLNWQPSFEYSTARTRKDIHALAPMTNNVHLQAIPAMDETERCPLAFAYFDVAHILRTLQRAGFDGYLEIEFVTQRTPYRAALAADVSCVNALLEDM